MLVCGRLAVFVIETVDMNIQWKCVPSDVFTNLELGAHGTRLGHALRARQVNEVDHTGREQHGNDRQ